MYQFLAEIQIYREWYVIYFLAAFKFGLCYPPPFSPCNLFEISDNAVNLI